MSTAFDAMRHIPRTATTRTGTARRTPISAEVRSARFHTHNGRRHALGKKMPRQICAVLWMGVDE
ncbi:MAG: hypothetical protein JWN03_2902 [Nocardia sp.]|uniref:hypothetical protein n=1 Tax=Nocardia sp. TaxID=1821 RepID=UPI0026266E48|nr:hypothetical protein [Nocardia sp.]MCU1642627.1 hypothetical protein [Nocardia sp.]